MAKQRKLKVKQYTEEFRREGVKRLKETDTVKALALELGSKLDRTRHPHQGVADRRSNEEWH